MAVLDNPIPPQPSSDRDLLETSKQLVKSSEDIRDILFALMAVLDQYPPSVITDAATGKQYNALAQFFGFVNVPRGGVGPYPFKSRNTSVSGTGQVQINGGDGSLASINDVIANVNGDPTNVEPYPQLAVTGNGVLYIKLLLSGDVTNTDVYFASSLPADDTASPRTFKIKQIATITGYDGSEDVPTFSIDDGIGPVGLTTATICGDDCTVT